MLTLAEFISSLKTNLIHLQALRTLVVINIQMFRLPKYFKYVHKITLKLNSSSKYCDQNLIF